MEQDRFKLEVEGRLMRMFSVSKEGYKTPAIERHRLEGFMQAGVFLGLVNNAELAELMAKVHLMVFGMSMDERKAADTGSWKNDVIDYQGYESPAYGRK